MQQVRRTERGGDTVPERDTGEAGRGEDERGEDRGGRVELGQAGVPADGVSRAIDTEMGDRVARLWTQPSGGIGWIKEVKKVIFW
jgi:hypothetical protein